MNKGLLVVGGFVAGYIVHREIMKLAFNEMLEKDYPKPKYTDYRDIVIGSREDAKDILSQLHDMIEDYGVVTIADLLNVVSYPSDAYLDYKYGWKILFGAYIAKGKNGYILKLPKPILLD